MFRGLIDRFLSTFHGDFTGFDSDTSPYPGVLWGCSGAVQAANTFRVQPGLWMGRDSGITDAWEDRVQIGFKTALEDINIPNTTAGFDRFDLISVPITKAALAVTGEIEVRDVKAPGAITAIPTNLQKRITHAQAAYTRTAGAEVAAGTGVVATNQPVLPAGHIRLWVVRKRDGAALASQDVNDYRQFSGWRPPPKVHEHDNEKPAGTKVSGWKNSIAGLCIPKAVGYFQGNGTGVTLTIQAGASTNIKSITRTADGNYTVTFYVPFSAALSCGGQGTCSVDGKIVTVNTNAGAGATATVKIFTSSTGALYQMAAGEFVMVSFFGEQ